MCILRVVNNKVGFITKADEWERRPDMALFVVSATEYL